MIPYGKQFIDKKDIRAVLAALRSPWLTQGPMVGAFEKKFAKFCGARYAVAFSNGTAALHLATQVLELPKSSQVITSPISFVATSNSVLYAGAKPVFSDIDSATLNLDATLLAQKISSRTSAIYPVHFAGLPCDMEAIGRIAKRKGLAVVEDACHALGARYKAGSRWHRVGSCAHSDMAVFSFHPVKHITTGEGGMITTNSAKYYERLKALRSHGIYRDAKKTKESPWAYEMKELGFNYRLTDIQSALGLSQMEKIVSFVSRRRKIAEQYRKAFKSFKTVQPQFSDNNSFHSYHLFPVRIDFKKNRMTRAELMRTLASKGIGSQVHYIPIYQQPYYRGLGYNVSLPEAERYYASALSLPMYPSMTDSDVKKVVRTLKGLLS